MFASTILRDAEIAYHRERMQRELGAGRRWRRPRLGCVVP